jgi:DNA polymerase-3 subunit delta
MKSEKEQKNVFAFVGDVYLRERAAQKLIVQLWQAQKRALISVEGRELAGPQLLEYFSGASLFDEAKVLLIRRADELPEPERVTERIAAGLSDALVLIFDADKLDKRSKLYKTIEKHGEIHEFTKPDRRSLPTLVRELLREHGVTVTPSGLKYLLGAVEPEPARLASEIKKLACYSKDRELDVTELRELLFSDQSESVLRFLDILGERSLQSLKQLRQLLSSGEDPNKIFFMIASQVRGLLAVKSLSAQKKSSEEIAKELGRFVWLVGKQRRMAQNFSEAELIALLHRLHEEDIRIKTGERTSEEALFDLVLAMTLSRSGPLYGI